MLLMDSFKNTQKMSLFSEVSFVGTFIIAFDIITTGSDTSTRQSFITLLKYCKYTFLFFLLFELSHSFQSIDQFIFNFGSIKQNCFIAWQLHTTKMTLSYQEELQLKPRRNFAIERQIPSWSNKKIKKKGVSGRLITKWFKKNFLYIISGLQLRGGLSGLDFDFVIRIRLFIILLYLV